MKKPHLETDTTSHVHILDFKQLFVSKFYGSQASDIMEHCNEDAGNARHRSAHVA